MLTKMMLAAIFLIPAAGHAQAAAGNPERAAVQQMVATLGEHLQAGNLLAIEPLFRTRGHILTDSATTHGWAEYRDKHLKPDLARMSAGYSHTAIEPVVRGDVAWVAFRRVFAASGALPQAQGRGTAVLEKANGHWRIVHLHLSQ